MFWSFFVVCWEILVFVVYLGLKGIGILVMEILPDASGPFIFILGLTIFDRR
jgi:hypothetical protein